MFKWTAGLTSIIAIVGVPGKKPQRTIRDAIANDPTIAALTIGGIASKKDIDEIKALLVAQATRPR